MSNAVDDVYSISSMMKPQGSSRNERYNRPFTGFYVKLENKSGNRYFDK